VRYGRLWIVVCLVVFTSVGVFCRAAHAYIDPGTGSYMFQLLIAGALAGAFVLRAFWGRVKDACRRACFWRQGDEARDE
jgi:drug/metabolite transporter (DMT)-like permease